MRFTFYAVLGAMALGGCLNAAPTGASPDMAGSKSDLGTSPLGDLGGFVFQADSPEVYVAKVKNVLVGLPPSDDEVNQVRSGAITLAALVDKWMALPAPSGSTYATLYEQKMSTFFQLAFQQTQITAADYINTDWHMVTTRARRGGTLFYDLAAAPNISDANGNPATDPQHATGFPSSTLPAFFGMELADQHEQPDARHHQSGAHRGHW